MQTRQMCCLPQVSANKRMERELPRPRARLYCGCLPAAVNHVSTQWRRWPPTGRLSHLIKLAFAGALERGRPLLHVASGVGTQRQAPERRDHLTGKGGRAHTPAPLVAAAAALRRPASEPTSSRRRRRRGTPDWLTTPRTDAIGRLDRAKLPHASKRETRHCNWCISYRADYG